MYNPNTYILFKYEKYLKHIYAFVTMTITTIYVFLINRNILTKIKLNDSSIKTFFVITYTLGITAALIENTAANFKRSIVLGFFSIFAIFCYSYLFINFAFMI